MELKKINCVKCGNLLPELRLTKYGYNFCVSCSDVTPKVGRVIVVGEGDHTATELEIVDQETAGRLHELENQSRRVKNVPVELLNFEEEESTSKVTSIPDSAVIVDDEDIEELEDEVEDIVELEDQDED